MTQEKRRFRFMSLGVLLRSYVSVVVDRSFALFKRSLTRDYVFFGGLMLVVLCVFVVIVGVRLAMHQSSVLHDDLTNKTAMVEKIFSGALHDIANNAEFLGDKIVRIGVDKPETKALFARSGTIDLQLYSTHSWLAFNFLKKDGSLLIDQGAVMHTSSHPIALAKQFPWQLQIGDIANNHHDIQAYSTVPVAMGITSPDGVYQGALIANVPVAKLEKNIQALADIHGDYFSYMIVDNAGRLLATSSLFSIIDNYSEGIPVLGDMASVTERSGLLPSAYEYSGILYDHYQKSPYSFWVVGGFSHAYRQAVFAEQFRPYIVLVCTLAFVFLLILYYFRRYIISPILHLSYVAKHIRSGAKHISIREQEGGRVYRRYPPEIHNLRVALVRSLFDKRREKGRNDALRLANSALVQRTDELQKARDNLQRMTDAFDNAEQVKLRMIEDIKRNTNNSISTLMVALVTLKEYIMNGRIDEMPDEQIHSIFKAMCQEVHHIQSFTSEQMRYQSLDVETVIGEAVALTNAYALKRGMAIEWFVQDSLPPMRSDLTSLTQIVVGLLHRSLDFMAEGDQIFLYAQQIVEDDTAFLVVSIKDNGLGWGEEEREARHKMYGGDYLAREIDGTDLSMPSVRALIERCHGTLECEDISGEGSEVVLTLPYDAKSYVPPSEQDEQLHSNQGSKVANGMSEDMPENVIPLHRD